MQKQIPFANDQQKGRPPGLTAGFVGSHRMKRKSAHFRIGRGR
jgi:hypothetical protein